MTKYLVLRFHEIFHLILLIKEIDFKIKILASIFFSRYPIGDFEVLVDVQIKDKLTTNEKNEFIYPLQNKATGEDAFGIVQVSQDEKLLDTIEIHALSC